MIYGLDSDTGSTFQIGHVFEDTASRTFVVSKWFLSWLSHIIILATHVGLHQAFDGYFYALNCQFHENM